MSDNDTLELLDRSRKFIEYVRTNVEFYDITFDLRDERWVGQPNQACSGYFSPDSAELVVAIGKPIHEWVTVLAHEYCHFIQWAYHRKEIWDAAFLPDGLDPSHVLEEWLDGKDYSDEVVQKSIELLMGIELDCEKRTVELLKHMDLPGIDLDEAVQKALSYVHFYPEVAKRRKWCLPEQGPYRIEKVWKAFPTKWDGQIVTPNYDPCFTKEGADVRSQLEQLPKSVSVPVQEMPNRRRV